MLLGLALLAGTALSICVPYGVWVWVVMALSLGGGALLWRYKGRGVALFILGLLALGMARGGMELAPPPLPDMGRWMVEGTVKGAVRQNEKAVTFTLSSVRVQLVGSEDWIEIASNLYVYYATTAETSLFHGQRVQVRGTSYLPNGVRNPGGFDQRMWMAQSGSHVRLYAANAPRILEPAKGGVYGAMLSVSASLGRHMDGLFGEAAPVVKAMLLGDQADVSEDWYGWMRDSGIVHILSVSGLHVALWFSLLEWLLRPLPISPRGRWVLLLVLLCAYAMITGLKVSAIRAVVMLLMVQGGRVARRKVDPLTSLALAAGVILLFRPLDLFSLGFQLSFSAVLGITLLYRVLSRLVSFTPKSVSSTLTMTLSAQLGMLPVSAHAFGKVAVIGLVTNGVAIPLAGALIPLAVAAMALNALWAPLGWLLVEASKGLVAVLLLIARAGAAVPFSTLRIGAFAWYVLVAYLLSMLLCSSAVVWRWRTRIVSMVAACCVVVGIGAVTTYRGVRYVQLDVGQALSGVLHAGGKTYVYDCGNENSDLTEYLLYTASSVEGLFLSHPHADHVGGLGELLDAGVPVGRIYVPYTDNITDADSLYEARILQARGQGIEIIELGLGDVLDLGGVTATVVGPTPPYGTGANERSLMLLLDIDGYTLLLCGDGDGTAEPLGVDCDVLQVAHHGSRNAAKEAFLAGATPEIAIISVGRNTYGHPHEETLARLQASAADIYLTQETGALTLYFDEEKIRAEAYIK